MNQKPTVVNLKLEQTKPVKCPKCGCEAFQEIKFMREVPGILSPTMKPEIVPVPGMECRKCHSVYEFGKITSEKVQKVVGIISAVAWIARTLKNLFRK